MKRLMKNSLICLFLFHCLHAFSQAPEFEERLSLIPGIQITPRTNSNFSGYYEISLLQPLDHSKPNAHLFRQRIFIGFQNFSAPNVMVTDGYAINYAASNDFSNELSSGFKANLIVVEHRFFGNSIPDTLDWNLLTTKQAADDDHAIKLMLDSILSGKWISTGISKGGQAALAYKVFYPDDVVATVVYGTAVKNGASITSDSILKKLSQTDCGERMDELQRYAFRNKQRLFPFFAKRAMRNGMNFGALDAETVFDYMLLELPFSFWQNGNSCKEIPDTTAADTAIVKYIVKIVPPGFFLAANRVSQEPAFYMFYHELGYYEYNTQPFQQWLKQKNYPNSYFAPQQIHIAFDSTYQNSLRQFLTTQGAVSVFFIYGENDPWALQTTYFENNYVVEMGNHKSRIANLSQGQKMQLHGQLQCLLFP